VTQKSTTSGSSFKFFVFSPIVSSTSRPLGEISLDPQSVCLAS
jgi:hypothetical protein